MVVELAQRHVAPALGGQGLPLGLFDLQIEHLDLMPPLDLAPIPAACVRRSCAVEPRNSASVFAIRAATENRPDSLVPAASHVKVARESHEKNPGSPAGSVRCLSEELAALRDAMEPSVMLW